MRSTLPVKTARSLWFGTCLLLLLVFVMPVHVLAQADKTPSWLPDLLEKESITIVVTDSGLGGLSVVADAAEKFKQQGVFKQVNLVFFNALFTDGGGYNALSSREEKLRVFNSALHSMQDRFSPDIILVACNTLSVLAPDTEFVRTASTPVVGIIKDGVRQIYEQLSGQPKARNILFATQGTVDEGTHKAQLLELGFDKQQIVTQSCPQLTLYIEQGYDSMYTEMLIDAYVDEALTQAGDIEGPLSVSFNCTHFGYSMVFWEKAFASRGVEVSAFLNPNTRMVDFLLPGDLQGRFEESKITIKVISMIDIPADRQDSIGRYLRGVSPLTEAALREFEFNSSLFEWRNPASGE